MQGPFVTAQAVLLVLLVLLIPVCKKYETRGGEERKETKHPVPSAPCMRAVQAQTLNKQQSLRHLRRGVTLRSRVTPRVLAVEDA